MQIQTPPQSPEELPRRLSAGRNSPPPPTPDAHDDEDDDSDSTATADSDLDEASQNSRRNSGSLAPPLASGAPTTGAPYNPFARTLATNEAAFGLQQTNDRQQESQRQDGEEATRASTGRPAMDVDQFKNILMTGSAAPSPPVNPPLQRIQDSSSSTDASSVSRQSLFDPYLEVHDETPRTSFDQMDSPPASGDDEEGSSLMSSSSRLDDFAPPAPPKHSHGKSLASKGPQTVSFADFEESIPSSQNSSRVNTPPVNTSLGGSLRPGVMPRSPSDLNKPLPEPPRESMDTERATMSTSDTTQLTSQQPIPSITTTEDSAQPKKAPPPPPASRRVGQTVSSQGRNRSPSNPAQNATPEEEVSLPNKTADSTPKPAAAPAPPPSRKSRPTSQISAPSVETPPDIPSPAPSTTDVKPMPPPPPRRNASKAGSAVNRSPSSASHSSVSRKDANPAANHNAPPAPPPRRGGNSKRDSMDGPSGSMASALNSHYEERRSSGTSVESGRWNSLSNVQQSSEPAETANLDSPRTENPASNDILSDMSAFQAEIDALRAKTEGRG